MIGEIRDLETAEAAVQASLTGHLVFSTLHTNDAPGAMTRLLDMGVEPFLVSSSVEGVLAQRLVRQVCEACAVKGIPDREDLPPDFKLPADATLTYGTGCRECRNSGLRGRLGIFELLTMGDTTRQMVIDRASSLDIARQAHADGSLRALRGDGFEKVRQGRTTIAEVLRATKA